MWFVYVFKSPLSQILKNSDKPYKIYERFWALLEYGGFKTALLKKMFKKKNIGMHFLHKNKQTSSLYDS